MMAINGSWIWLCILTTLLEATYSERPQRAKPRIRQWILKSDEHALVQEKLASDAYVNYAEAMPKIDGKRLVRFGLTHVFYHSGATGLPPYKERKPIPPACKELNCNHIRVGIGRKGVVSYWVLAVLGPVVTTLLIIFATSLKPHTPGALNTRTDKMAVAMLASLVLMFFLGRWTVDVLDKSFNDMCLNAFVLLIMIIFIIATFWAADVEFSWPKVFSSSYIEVVSIGYFIGFVVLWIWLELVLMQFRRTSWFAGYFLTVISVGASLTIPQNSAYVLWMCYMTVSHLILFYLWGDTTGLSDCPCKSVAFPRNLAPLVASYLCFAIPYCRDRCFVVTFFTLLTLICVMGQENQRKGNFDGHVGRNISLFVFWFVIFSATCVATRFQIVLPPRLQKIRYIRLGYLYELRRTGRLISRCQELPETAFGNPAKVMHLVIISHHWLDGLTCDLATPECPGGFRLTTMCQRLEDFFPSAWPGFQAFCYYPITTLIKAVWSAMQSENDVLLFFDFPCLPQKGKSADGSAVERSKEDQALFEEVLPACGLLYTMFPVMVCPEVSDGVTSYSSSGWCFCEWEQSKLCGTLLPYSDETLDAAPKATASHREILSSIEVDLQSKLFRCEGDREIVRGIVIGTFIRRQLFDAVVDQEAEQVIALLKELTEHKLEDTISFPVDPMTLDTLLHVAKKLPSSGITASLLNYGADPTRPNHRGEQPGEFLIFPRAWVPSCLARSF